VSKLGNDPVGEEILYRLNAEKVDTNHVIITDKAPTGLMLKEKTIEGDPRVYYYRSQSAASTLGIVDVNETIIKNAKIMHVTGITPALSDSCRELVFHVVQLAKKAGTKVSFDPNIRLKLWSEREARETLIPLIKEVDYFFPGISEGQLLLGDKELTEEQIIDSFIELGAGQVILKLGPKGCITANKEKRSFSKGFSVKEIDSVGAGDGFCAGYLTGLLKGWTHEECAVLANAVGAIAVSQPGDYEALPTWEEVQQFIGNRETIRR
jgi:2-dehydro-3-deoxygluconokinase